LMSFAPFASRAREIYCSLPAARVLHDQSVSTSNACIVVDHGQHHLDHHFMRALDRVFYLRVFKGSGRILQTSLALRSSVILGRTISHSAAHNTCIASSPSDISCPIPFYLPATVPPVPLCNKVPFGRRLPIFKASCNNNPNACRLLDPASASGTPAMSEIIQQIEYV